MEPDRYSPHDSSSEPDEDTAAVTARMLWACRSRSPAITAIAAHALFSPGKLLRTRLGAAASRVFGVVPGPTMTAVFSAVELLHNASLVHDDDADSDDLRRGREAVHRRFGHTLALLTGDLLFVAAQNTLDTFCPQYHSSFGAALERVFTGFIDEIWARTDLHTTPDQCIRINADKTGALFALIAGIAAQEAGLPAADAARVARAGLKLGIAYQLQDDRLDYLASAKDMGKVQGSDFASGVPTFPLVVAAERTTAEESHLLKTHFGAGTPSPEVLAEVIRILERRGGLRATRNVASQYAIEARETFHLFAREPAALRALDHLIDTMIDRNR